MKHAHHGIYIAFLCITDHAFRTTNFNTKMGATLLGPEGNIRETTMSQLDT